jgi:hypothetical protein
MTNFRPDPSPWVNLTISNRGRAAANDFKTDCVFNGRIVIDVNGAYTPRTIKDGAMRLSNNGGSNFMERIEHFPANSEVQYTIILDQFINDKWNQICEFSTPDKNWTGNTHEEPIDINNSKSSLQFLLVNEAFAAETQANNTEGRSGIFLDGYDPIKMANDTIQLLLKKEIITNDESKNIIRLTESHKEGVLLGGVNILKFDEELINLMVRKKIIDNTQAATIVERAKNAGGVLIGGYNVIVINIEILNALLKNKRIELSEGQPVVDGSRQPPFRVGISKVGDPLGPSSDPIIMNSPRQ